MFGGGGLWMVFVSRRNNFGNQCIEVKSWCVRVAFRSPADVPAAARDRTADVRARVRGVPGMHLRVHIVV